MLNACLHVRVTNIRIIISEPELLSFVRVSVVCL